MKIATQTSVTQTRPPIKAILFDLDDTLWPLLPLINYAEQTLFDWLQLHAPKVTQQHTIQSMRTKRTALIETNPRFQFDLWALRHAGLTQLFLDEGEDVVKVDQAMQVFAHARNQVELYPDVHPILGELSKHYSLGSISNGFANVDVIGLNKHFQVSLAAHQFGCAKPDPRIFLAACSALAIAPQNAVYVGDDAVLDVQGAQQAGLSAVWLNRAGRKAPEAIQADFECRDLQELSTWLTQKKVDC